jgi:pantoate--beta-alanine ligase
MGNREKESTPRLVDNTADLRRAVADARAAGKTIGLVPTMGALHEGHLSLVRASRAECDLTVVTIFVNPTQFGPHEDLEKYPRTLENDLRLLAGEGADLAFAPPREALYPAGFSTYVDPPDVALTLEGKCRPGHFRGVTTIVLKLFNLAQAHVAYFGQKDYQQARVIDRMVHDLDVPIIIRVCPIVRESDGLAMSSRNRYMNPAERDKALALWRCLTAARDLVASGQRDAATVATGMRAVLQEREVTRIDYAALADPDTLQPVTTIEGPTMALVAAHVGKTRLIDNLRLEP